MHLFTEQVIGFIFAVLIIYSSFKLFDALKNKETAISMIFLHKKEITYIFALLVLTSFIIFLTSIGYVMGINEVWIDILLALNALGLFIFIYILQRIMRGDVNV